MVDVKYAIGIKGNLPFPIFTSDDPARNGLRRLGEATEGGHEADATRDDREWHKASLGFLKTHAPAPGVHRTVDLAPVSQAGVSALDTPWYAVFETDDHQLWVARFFDENLGFEINAEGVFIVDVDPGLLNPGDVTDAYRPLRSVVAVSRDTVSGAPTAGRDHGSGGGVIRTNWE